MNLSLKIHKILKIFLLAFAAILLKVWHLSVIQREEKLLEAQKPQQRTILVKAERGTLCDRFGIEMACNRICYNAAIYYGQISQIPQVIWRTNEDGKQIKILKRKEYIKDLALVLGKTLSLDAERLEDLIHSKAALFPHVPFVLKTGLTEEEYYHLKMMEKDWPGIYAEIGSSRYYPWGKTGCHLLGTMGAISQKEYMAIAGEMSQLQLMELFDEPIETHRLAELKEKAYKMTDLIGKGGLEERYEEELRGIFGKKTFEVDQQGRFVREIFEKKPIAGKKVVLTLSAELQQFAESLLSLDEKIRDGRSIGLDPADKKRKVQKQPWIKGGAIAALDPKTGEVLALASFPRFDPNDFILQSSSIFKEGKAKQVNRWLENEPFIGAVWDGLEMLKRERGRLFTEEEISLTWERILEFLLPKEGALRQFFSSMDDLKGAVRLQEDYEAYLYYTKSNLPVPMELAKRLESTHLNEKDLVFAVDLCRTVVYAPAFTDELLRRVGSMKIADYQALSQKFHRLEHATRQKCREHFRTTEFAAWKAKHQKEFLTAKRKEEKENKAYAKPYIDYLDKQESELFEAYWQEHRFAFLASPEMPEDLMRTFRSFKQLNRPLLGSYRKLRNFPKEQTEKEMAAAFYPIGGFGFFRSYGFEASSPQGSTFKLVTAYEGLKQNKHLTIIDELSSKGVAYTMDRHLYPRLYKGGRLPRSAAISLGVVDLYTALERSSNPYFSILAGDHFSDPEDLANAARLFGFGEKTGLELFSERRGNVPSDLRTNRTGLYATAIGQHTLLSTPLQTSLMISAIANGGKLLKPKLVKEIVGQKPDREFLSVFAAHNYLGEKELKTLGVPFPLFTGVGMAEPLLEDHKSPIEVRRTIPLDPKIRSTLLEGMDRVVSGAHGSARPSIIKALHANPLLKRDYLDLQHQMVGKTGSAEIACDFSVTPTSRSQLYKYIWFGSTVFEQSKFEDPELTVVVFLRYGDAGKEAAPLAAQMIHKWREIKKKHSLSSDR